MTKKEFIQKYVLRRASKKLRTIEGDLKSAMEAWDEIEKAIERSNDIDAKSLIASKKDFIHYSLQRHPDGSPIAKLSGENWWKIVKIVDFSITEKEEKYRVEIIKNIKPYYTGYPIGVIMEIEQKLGENKYKFTAIGTTGEYGK